MCLPSSRVTAPYQNQNILYLSLFHVTVKTMFNHLYCCRLEAFVDKRAYREGWWLVWVVSTLLTLRHFCLWASVFMTTKWADRVALWSKFCEVMSECSWSRALGGENSVPAIPTVDRDKGRSQVKLDLRLKVKVLRHSTGRIWQDQEALLILSITR